MTTRESVLVYTVGKLAGYESRREVEERNTPSYIPEMSAGIDNPIHIPVRKVL